jgi:dihydroorotate dehydrogenase
MNASTRFLRYDRTQTYRWNYEHAPDPVEIDVAAVPGSWTFCGRSVPSPLGVPAGPLLNGRWLLYYASLGFDVLTYKTVRSGERACYDLPNLQPVRCEQIHEQHVQLPASDRMDGSWAVSFGMPSAAPDLWRADVEATRRKLPGEKLLVVSVVGTVQPGWSIETLAEDYALCGRWAVESGADAIETNFSCPNVSTCDGQLYQNPDDAAVVAAAVRRSIGAVPLVAKIGRIADDESGEALVSALAPYVDALAMTNSIATTVASADGALLFDGERRGICGAAIRDASIEQLRRLHPMVQRKENIPRPALPMRLIGVGGISTAADVRECLLAGAESVQLATAAMVDPAVAVQIRKELAAQCCL